MCKPPDRRTVDFRQIEGVRHMSNYLSEHFTLEELAISQEAGRRRIDNMPTLGIIQNLRKLCAVLEQVRSLLGDVPILISSGYRCLALNTSIGGTVNSMHMQGLAVDFTAPRFGAAFHAAGALAASSIAYDQVIYEYGTWVHLGLAPEGQSPRRQKLSSFSGSDHVCGIVGRPLVM